MKVCRWVTVPLVSAVLALAGLVAGCGGAAPASPGAAASTPAAKQSPQALIPIDFRLDWIPGGEHTPYYVAKAKGFFRDEGLDVTIHPGEGSSVTIKLVGTGKEQFGIAAASSILQGVAEGVPIKSIGIIFQETPSAIIALNSSGIQKPEDLVGKNLGVFIKSVTYPEWEAMADKLHIDRKQIHELPMDKTLSEALGTKRIDAGIGWYINDGMQAQVEGIPVHWIKFSDLGLHIYSSAVIASTEYLKTHADVARRFMIAVAKGWQYTRDHPQEALAILHQAEPKINEKLSEAKLPSVLDLNESADVKDHGFGYSVPARWQTLADALHQFGVLKQQVNVNDVFTNDFVVKQ